MVMTQLTPATVQGSVVQPTAVIDAKSEAAHGFLNVVRDVIQRGNVYHSESEQTDALRAVDAYGRSLIPSTTLQALHEESPVAAPREDVSLRVPPGGAMPVPVSAHGQPIDYNKLAAAIVAAQRAQSAPADDVPADSEE